MRIQTPSYEIWRQPELLEEASQIIENLSLPSCVKIIEKAQAQIRTIKELQQVTQNQNPQI